MEKGNGHEENEFKSDKSCEKVKNTMEKRVQSQGDQGCNGKGRAMGWGEQGVSVKVLHGVVKAGLLKKYN